MTTMLSCKDVTERASDLIDGNLSTWNALQMRLHLAMCKGCDAFVGQLRMTRDVTRSVAEVEALHEPDGARIEAILSQLHESKRNGG
jgi:anti-sigma factor RsiW